MEKLVNPDFGLTFWTIFVFLTLLFILSKTAWKPLITALEERESRLQAEKDAAEAARKAAESLKEDLERELGRIAAKAQEAMAQAVRDGQKTKDEIMRGAQDEAKTLLEKTRKQLEDDKERLVRELRGQVAELSVLAAEKIMKHTMDGGTQKRLLDDFFKELDGVKR